MFPALLPSWPSLLLFALSLLVFAREKCQCWWFLMKHIHVDKRLRYLHWRLPALLSLYWSRAIVGWSELTLPSSGMKISWTKTGVILKETCNILHERYKHLSIKPGAQQWSLTDSLTICVSSVSTAEWCESLTWPTSFVFPNLAVCTETSCTIENTETMSASGCSASNPINQSMFGTLQDVSLCQLVQKSLI